MADDASDVVPRRALVLGLGVTGRAVTEALVAHGAEVAVTDDRLEEGPAVAEGLGARWVDPPAGSWAPLVARHDAILPSPGVAEHHPVFAAATETDTPVRSELDLAAAWDDRPVALITGTNGKTSVTLAVTDMLRRSGVAATAAGNLEVPLVTAIADPGPEAFVVEASSFRLTFATALVPTVATWLNFAPDHLDVHHTLADYEQAKAQIWRNHETGGLAVANLDDAVVRRHAPGGDRTQTFGLGHAADWHVAGGVLRGPEGLEVLAIEAMARSLPHDVANALAAAATATAMGATIDAIRAALVAGQSLPHRVELVGESGQVRWYDDSKATAPHATVAALAGFDSAVLIAGGRNKGLDLTELGQVTPRLRAVVAIGEAAPEVVAVFEGHVPTGVADSMDDAVAQAGAAAVAGDVVVLSPACASFDRYRSYSERGDDFQRAVRQLIGVTT